MPGFATRCAGVASSLIVSAMIFVIPSTLQARPTLEQGLHGDDLVWKTFGIYTWADQTNIVIDEQPRSQSVVVGTDVYLSVSFSGSHPATLQWQKDGTNIPNATWTPLWISAVQSNNAGVYSATISNNYGTVTSSNAFLHVVPRVNLAVRGTVPGFFWDVDVVGNSAFGLSTNGLIVFDVTDPTSPVQIGGVFSLYGFRGKISVSGHYAYVATGYGLLVFDVSDLQHPTNVANRYISAGATDVQLVGQHAFVTGSYGLQIFDVSNPANPVWLAEAFSQQRRTDIYILAPFAYVVGPYNGLAIFDITQPNLPTDLGNHPVPGAESIDFDGRFTYIAAGTNGLTVLDAINPTTPATVVSYNPGRPWVDVDVLGSDAFMAAETPPGLQIVDLSIPSLPAISSYTYDYLPGGHAVDVTGRYAFLGSYSGLFVVEKVGAVDSQPVIRTAPMDQIVREGGTAKFSVTAMGDPPIAYQWYFRGTNLAGATNFLLTLTNVNASATGTYAVLVTNRSGGGTSAEASLDLLREPVIITTGIAAPQFIPTNGFRFAFLSQQRVKYTIEYADTLGPTQWFPITNLTGNGAVNEVLSSTAGQSSRFFRVRTHY
jgi:hypothetical protein